MKTVVYVCTKDMKILAYTCTLLSSFCNTIPNLTMNLTVNAFLTFSLCNLFPSSYFQCSLIMSFLKEINDKKSIRKLKEQLLLQTVTVNVSKDVKGLIFLVFITLNETMTPTQVFSENDLFSVDPNAER